MNRLLAPSLCAAALASSLVITASAADVGMLGDDSFGTSSFNTAAQWSDSLAPSAGNNYSNSGYLLRTPATAENYTFAGDLLSITGTGLATGANTEALMWKGTGTTSVITVNNLLIDGGQLRHGQGTADTFTLAGNLAVGDNGANFATQGGMIVAAAISGSNPIRILSSGNTDARRTVTLTSSSTTFTGDIEMAGPAAANARLTLAENANLNFVIGAGGTNNSVFGTGTVAYNGLFNFDLSGAGTSWRDSWGVASASNQTFGETFTVAGFDDAGDGLWRQTVNATTYQFSETTGRLSVLPSSLGTFTWTGTSGTNWNVAGNWSPAQAVGEGVYDLVYTGTASSLTSTNDNLAGVTAVTSLSFAADAAGYTVNGNQFALLGDIQNDSLNTQTISAAVELFGDRTVQTVADGGIILAGEVSGAAAGLATAGAGSVTLSGINSYTGNTVVGGSSQLLISGDIPAGASLLVGNATGDRAVATISGNVTVGNMNGIGGDTGSGAVYQSSGSVNLTDGTADTNLSLGGVGNNVSAGYGYYGMSGGQLTANRIVAGARADGAIGILEVTGGSVSVNESVNVGRSGNLAAGAASGLLNVAQGNLAFGLTATAGRLQAGFAPGSAVINIGGGSASASVDGPGVELANQNAVGATSVLNLLANGTLTTGQIYGSQAGPTALVNFDGGLLQASATNSGAAFMTSGNVDAVTIYAGGGTIDNAGSNITIGNGLLAPIGEGVASVGVATAGSGYIAPPLVEFSGDGVGATGYAVLTNDQVSGIVITSPGTGYTAAPTVTLIGGGAETPAAVGTVTLNGGTVGGGMTFQGFGTTTLTGTSTYTGPTLVTGGTLSLAGTGSLTGSSGITVQSFGTTLRLASSEASPVPVTLDQGNLEGTGTLGAVSIGGDGLSTITNSGGNFTFAELAFGGGATANLTLADGAAIAVTGSLSTTPVTGTVAISVTSTQWVNGTNPLIGYGSFSGSANDFFLVNVAGLTGRQSATGLVLADNAVALNVDGDSPVWSGANGGVWTTGVFGVVGPNPNWSLAIAHTPTDFWPDDVVEFNDTVNIGGTVAPPTTTAVSIQGGAVSPRVTTFNNAILDYSLSTPDGSGIATGSIVKNGAGSLTIAVPNTTTDGIVLNAGRINANDSLALGLGSLEINGGTLGNTSGFAQFNGNSSMLQTWAGDFAFEGISDGTADLNLGNGVVSLDGSGDARAVSVSAGTLTVGPIAGGSTELGLTKAGDGTLTIDSVTASQIAGTLAVTGGTVNIGQNDFVAGGLTGGGTVANGSGTTRWLFVGNATDQTFSGSLEDGVGGGLLGFVKRGNGTLTLTGTSGMSSRLTVEAGALEISGGGAITNAESYFVTNSGVLRLDGPGSIGSNAITISSSNAAPSTWSNRLELAGGAAIANEITFAQRNNETDGIVNVSGDNTLSGPLTIIVGGTSARVRSDAGRLDLAGTITTNATSARNLWLRGAGTGVVSGTIVDNAANVNGRLNIHKDGSGTWTLSGGNTFTGTSSVYAGTLMVNGSIGTSSGVAVSEGGTLAGSGTVATTTIQAGGTLSPGDGVGALATTGGVTWASGGNLNWQLTDATGGAGSGWDLLAVTDSLAISATSADPFKINLWTVAGSSPFVDGPAANFNPATAYSWTIASTTTGITGFVADAFAVVTTASNGTGGFSNSFTGTFSVAEAGNDLQLVYTPGGASTDIVIDVPSGSQTQADAGYATISSATSVTKTGLGVLVMDATNAYTGPTTVSAGTLEVATANALAATNITVDTAATLAVANGTTMRAPSVIVDGGTLSAAAIAVNASAGITSLAINAGTITGSSVVTISAGGEMSLVQDARVSVAIGGLSVDQASGGGRLDLGAGQVSIAAGGITATDLRADMIAGRNGGAWNGLTGITSSAAAASGGTRAVGYLVAGDGAARVSFAAPGDVDLSGAVNVFDLVSINSSGKYGTGAASVWSQGDFNYDGVTNVFDLVSVNTAGAYGQGSYFPASPSASGFGSVAAVPEPGTSALVGAISGLAIAWRGFRRRCRQ